MSGTTSRRHLVAEGAWWVRSGALATGAALLVAAAVRDVLGGRGDAGTVGDVWQALLQLSVAAFFLAQAVRVGVQFPDGLHRPGDRRLPRWGHAGRLGFRACAGVAACCYLVWGALLFSDVRNSDGDLITDNPWVGGVLSVAIFVPGLLALATMLVWGASEAWAGYREPRVRPTSPSEPRPRAPQA